MRNISAKTLESLDAFMASLAFYQFYCFTIQVAICGPFGTLWDALLIKILQKHGWKRIYEWQGVFVHPDGSSLVAHVDDLLIQMDIISLEEMWYMLAVL